jgi:hypothetical protein
MFRNYIKTAWRNIVRNKFSSFINIGGLAVGMAATLLIALWINDQLSFNKYHKSYNRIAQVTQNLGVRLIKKGNQYFTKQDVIHIGSTFFWYSGN